MYNPEITTVLLCCRAYLQTGTISELKTYISTHTVHWEQVYDLCAQHRVRPVALQVFSRIQDVIPAGVLQRLRTYCRDFALFTFDRKMETERLLSRLRTYGVDARIYKGMDLSQLIYGDLAMREFTDVDVIIKEEHAGIVIEVLKEEGYAMHLESYFRDHEQHFKQHCKDVTFSRLCPRGRRFSFEFHYRPTRSFMSVSYQFSDLLGQDYLSARALTAEEYYHLMLVNNGVSDFYPSLRSLMDMVLLYRRGPFEVPSPLRRFEQLWKPLAASLLAFPDGDIAPVHNKTHRLLIKRLLHRQAGTKSHFLHKAFVNIVFGEDIKAKASAFLRHCHFMLRPSGYDLTLGNVPYFLLYFIRPFRITYSALKRMK